jgi:hypothetical protein
MNVRFSNQSIRCRVKRAELDGLLAGRAIALEVALPRDHVFRVNVRPSPLEEWKLDSDPTGVWITIPLPALRSLSEALPSREGIAHAFPLASGESVVVSFEVDVKEGRRA